VSSDLLSSLPSLTSSVAQTGGIDRKALQQLFSRLQSIQAKTESFVGGSGVPLSMKREGEPLREGLTPIDSPQTASTALSIAGSSSDPQEIMDNISRLQTNQTGLISHLTSCYATSNSCTPEEITYLTDQITELTKMRYNLYQALDRAFTFYGKVANASSETLTSQRAALEIIENELSIATDEVTKLTADRAAKLRLVEINNYYGDRYTDHTYIMKVVVYTLIPVLALSFVRNYGYLPPTLYGFLVVITVLLGVFFLMRAVGNTMSRDPNNYQEYDWYFDPAHAPPIQKDGKFRDIWYSSGGGGGGCTNSGCCSPGMTYDTTSAVCVGERTDAVTMGTSTDISAYTLGKNYASQKASALYGGLQGSLNNITSQSSNTLRGFEPFVPSISDNGYVPGAAETIFGTNAGMARI